MAKQTFSNSVGASLEGRSSATPNKELPTTENISQNLYPPEVQKPSYYMYNYASFLAYFITPQDLNTSSSICVLSDV